MIRLGEQATGSRTCSICISSSSSSRSSTRRVFGRSLTATASPACRVTLDPLGLEELMMLMTPLLLLLQVMWLPVVTENVVLEKIVSPASRARSSEESHRDLTWNARHARAGFTRLRTRLAAEYSTAIQHLPIAHNNSKRWERAKFLRVSDEHVSEMPWPWFVQRSPPRANERASYALEFWPRFTSLSRTTSRRR